MNEKEIEKHLDEGLPSKSGKYDGMSYTEILEKALQMENDAAEINLMLLEKAKPQDREKFIEIAKGKDQLFELNEIRRQKQKWMKEASIEFSKLNTIEGLTKYENHGNIKEFETKSDLIKFAAESYVNGDASVVLCHRRETCRLVNEKVRKLRREQGEIGDDITNINGKNFAINDKVMFFQNDRNLGIKNGQNGVILRGNQEC